MYNQLSPDSTSIQVFDGQENDNQIANQEI